MLLMLIEDKIEVRKKQKTPHQMYRKKIGTMKSCSSVSPQREISHNNEIREKRVRHKAESKERKKIEKEKRKKKYPQSLPACQMIL